MLMNDLLVATKAKTWTQSCLQSLNSQTLGSTTSLAHFSSLLKEPTLLGSLGTLLGS